MNNHRMGRSGAAVIVLLFGVQIVLTEVRAQSVTPLSSGTLDSLIRTRNGRPLVLNVWATWCAPCKEEFPDLLGAAADHANVDVAAVSVDYPDEVASKIRPFLIEMKITVPVFVSAFGKQEVLIERLAPSWNGALPATFLFTRSGVRDTFYVGKQSREKFRAAFDRAAGR